MASLQGRAMAGCFVAAIIGAFLVPMAAIAQIAGQVQPARSGTPPPGASAPVRSVGQETATARPQGSVRLPTAQEPSSEGAQRGGEGAPSAGGATEKGDTPMGEEMVYLNVQDQDIKDVIKQISKATGKNFIIDDKIRGKVTILSERPMTKEEAYQAFLSALEMALYTTVTGPGGIIKVVSLKDAASSPIPVHVDSTPYTDSYVTRLIKLNKLNVSEVEKAIKPLISGSAKLFPYPATNTLILTDSGTNIDRLMKIIKELDQGGEEQVLEIIPIIYADAKDVAQKVISLFEIEKSGAGPARKAGDVAMEDIKAVSKIISDDRTNSLIVLASKRAIDEVRSVIAKLDVPLKQGDTGQIHVHYLKYAKAADLSQTLSSIVSGAKAATKTAGKEGEKGGAAAKGGGPLPVTQLEGGISIGADETTNALIITASAKDYQVLVDELISKLDIPARQVYLESVVMELEVNRGKNYGASGYAGAGNRTLIGFGGTSFSQPPFSAISGLFNPTSFFATPGILGGLLSRDKVTIDVPNGSGGSTTLEIPAFSAFLNALQTYRDFNIVSTPNILTVDNQKASIEVTRKQYIPQTTITATAGATTAGSQPVEAGLTLEITPQITEGDAVRMQIHQKLSNFTGTATATLGPPETKREITTTVVAMDGQTVVLGGLMEDVTSNQKSKVPLLGDIPLLGLLFQSTAKTSQKSNLLVFITPHVIKDPSDFGDITKSKIEQRNAFIEQNFGKRQQRQIRDVIAAHRADLLEYTPTVTYGPASSSSTALPPPGPSPAMTPSPAVRPISAPTPLPPASSSPVITVPSAGAGSSGGAVIASSASQPVAPVRPAAKKAPSSSPSKSPAGTKDKGVGEVDLAY